MIAAIPAWWRRNRVALIALVVLVPLAAGVYAGLPLLDDLTYDPQPTRTIAVGESASRAGITLTVDGSLDARTDVADDMSLIGVLVTLDAGAIDFETDDLICVVSLTDEGPGGSGERQWALADRPEDLGWRYLDDTRDYCDLAELTGPTQYEFVFYAPPGTYDQATLRVDIFDPDLEDIGDGGGIELTVIEPDLRFALDYSEPPA